MSTDTTSGVFASWLERFGPLVARVARTYADGLEDQNDLSQEILLQLWSSIRRFRGEASETTWVYRVALNAALVWTRTQSRRRKNLPMVLVEPGELSASGAAPDCTDETIARLYEAIHQLPGVDRSLLLMHLDGLPYEQMADVLGITPNNMGVRLSRAKKKLAELLKGILDDI